MKTIFTLLAMSLTLASVAQAEISYDSSYTTFIDPGCTHDSGGGPCSQDLELNTDEILRAALNGEISAEEAADLLKQNAEALAQQNK